MTESIHEAYLDETEGLWIPMRFRETRQLVIRTPRATIQHFPGDSVEGYHGMIDGSHFGQPEDLFDCRNPDLAPDQVSLKAEGEPAETFTLDLDLDQEEVDRDG